MVELGLGLATGLGKAKVGAKDPGSSSPLEIEKALQEGANGAIKTQFL